MSQMPHRRMSQWNKMCHTISYDAFPKSALTCSRPVQCTVVVSYMSENRCELTRPCLTMTRSEISHTFQCTVFKIVWFIALQLCVTIYWSKLLKWCKSTKLVPTFLAISEMLRMSAFQGWCWFKKRPKKYINGMQWIWKLDFQQPFV